MTHLKENIAPVKKEKELLKADQELKLKIMSMLEPLYQTLHQVQSLAHESMQLSTKKVEEII